MLTPQDNELLVRVGPGTPMGQLFRRFWTPILMSEEIAEPDGPPVRVHVLGEKLVAFRDTEGRIGLLDTHCAHRRANLFFGRNEQCGLRCVYHGWKYDVTGQCVDIPNADEGERIKHEIKLKSYPTLERAGMVWAYMGPPDRKPDLPLYDVFSGPSNHRQVRKFTIKANWAQVMEGDIDSSHITFLHARVDGANNNAVRDNLANALTDKSPRWITRETDYGLLLAAQRDLDQEHFYYRINQWLMPYCTLIASPNDKPIIVQIRVPIDDENTLHFRAFYNRGYPLSAEDLAYSNSVIFPETDPATGEMREARENDYLIDREEQAKRTFSGIRSVVAQDLAMTEDQDGPIFDRSREFLTTTDGAIVAVRRRLIGAAKALASEGNEPPEVGHAASYAIRPCQIALPRHVDVQTGAREAMTP